MHGSGAVGLNTMATASADLMSDPLLQLNMPQQLVERIRSIESSGREVAGRTETLGQVVPAEKEKLPEFPDAEFPTSKRAWEAHVGLWRKALRDLRNEQAP